MAYIKKYGLPLLLVIALISILVYLYIMVLTPLKEQETYLLNEKQSYDMELINLRSIMNQHDRYQAEMLSYKSILDRYNDYADEYGSYESIILFIEDIERRAGVDLHQIRLTEQSLSFDMDASYHGAKIFITALENIEFLYTANRISLSAINERFVPRITSDLSKNRNLRVSIDANFHLDTIEETKNLISVLIKEIGVRNAYVLE
jgi:ribosome-binding factor A